MSSNLSGAPRIAIVGSYDPLRAKKLSLKNAELASEAGRELGRELARQGCHIVVYSSYPHLLELDVVRGYVEVKAAKPVPGCIQVHYSLNFDVPAFFDAGQEPDPAVADMFADRPDHSAEWEVSFYRSLRDVDGMLTLGGGPSVMIAGVVAAGHRKPIVAVASFGGAARKIWEMLRTQMDRVTPDDIATMGMPWKPSLARQCVGILVRQCEEAHKEKSDQQSLAARVEKAHGEELARREEKLRAEFEARLAEALRDDAENTAVVKRYVITAAVFLVLALASVAIALGAQGIPRLLLVIFSFVTPLVAGVCGSTIRVAFDASGILTTGQHGEPKSGQKLRPVITSAGMGFVGGGIMLLLYLTTLGVSAGEIEDKDYPRLIPFVALAGLGAGFALDVVARKLRETTEGGGPSFTPRGAGTAGR